MERRCAPSRLRGRAGLWAPNNNGNVYAQRITAPGGIDLKQSYGYDAWNRLETFQEAPWSGGVTALSEKYCYDEHGNRAVEARAG